MSDSHALSSWRPGPTRDAIVEFVETVTTPGEAFVPPAERLATFDNDGTLWCEKPMPIQLPGGARVLELHRLGRWSRLHTTDQRGDVRIPRERVIGSASTFEYTSDEHGGAITHNAEADFATMF